MRNEHLVKAQLVSKIWWALDQDVQILVQAHHNRKNAPALQVF